ncbi:uncharacterized protein N7483_010561 [Penicillium malachiteum]|uniref:uncharacterized protein n=1 Tax=Penicillium malachiteum TaxID=1324776 RepID=UPI0025499F48|nr:uncharacterized protein N7483_010561 [Penicillium malachiteum]KAJ5713380.1 hypothetical protein N7483_010561 [Penicillium malachiteum]
MLLLQQLKIHQRTEVRGAASSPDQEFSIWSFIIFTSPALVGALLLVLVLVIGLLAPQAPERLAEEGGAFGGQGGQAGLHLSLLGSVAGCEDLLHRPHSRGDSGSVDSSHLGELPKGTGSAQLHGGVAAAIVVVAVFHLADEVGGHEIVGQGGGGGLLHLLGFSFAIDQAAWIGLTDNRGLVAIGLATLRVGGVGFVVVRHLAQIRQATIKFSAECFNGSPLSGLADLVVRVFIVVVVRHDGIARAFY